MKYAELTSWLPRLGCYPTRFGAAIVRQLAVDRDRFDAA